MSKQLARLILVALMLGLAGFARADLLMNGDFETDSALVPNPGDTDANAPTGWAYDRYYGYDIDPWLMNISAIGDGSGGNTGVVFGTWNADAAWDPAMATYPETPVEAGQYILEVTTASTGGTVEGWLDVQLGWFADPADPWADYAEFVREWVDVSGFGDGVWTTLSWNFEVPADDPGVGQKWYLWLRGQSYDDYVIVGEVELKPRVTIPVDPNSDLAAANAMAMPGDIVAFAPGTYVLSSQIDVKSGVTYLGAGPDLTIIDCNDVTRAFAAWGDRSATGLVDANGVEIPNRTGQTGWVIEGLTIQNGMTAAEDDGLDLSNDGAGVLALNGASGAIENCAFIDCNAVDDGGAIRAGSGAVLDVNNCTFSGMFSGDDGAVFMTNGGASMTVDQCFIADSLAGDQGGAGRVGSDDSFFSLTNSVIDNVDAADDCAVFRSGASGSRGLFMANCLIINCDTVDDNIIEVRGASNKILNCTFVNNTVGDRGMIRQGTDAQHPGSENVFNNNIFVGNSNEGSGDDFFTHRTDLDTQPVTVMNNLFFDNFIDSGELGLGAMLGEHGNIEGDPLFVGPDDFHIASVDSPAVDASDPATATETDIEGNAAVDVRDIGAYESVNEAGDTAGE